MVRSLPTSHVTTSAIRAARAASIRNNRDSKLGNALAIADDVHSNYTRVKEWYNNRTRWTVTIDSKDRLYDAVLRWFLDSDSDTAPPRAVKAVLSSSGGGRRSRFWEEELASSNSDRVNDIQVYYDEKGTRVLDVKGHKVIVNLIKPEPPDSVEGSNYRAAEPDRIYFYAKSREGQLATLDLLREIANMQSSRKAALHLMSTWGDWQRRDDLPQRPLDSVVLAAGQMERLRDDLTKFLEEESEYTRRGLPYHRGYLLYGPPGTGKTSIVRALAANFELDLWYAPLGDLEKDTSLISLINQVRPGSILLLEDIDVYHASRDRDDEQKGASMAGLLNALDGVATPHGLITFMTTNDRSVIDEALLRPGRIDVQEEIGLPDQEQIARLFASWYNVTLDDAQIESITFTGTTAAVTEIFKQHIDDPTPAIALLQKRNAPAEKRSVTDSPNKENRDERRTDSRRRAVRRVEGRIDAV